jgi:hypothetical protein
MPVNTDGSAATAALSHEEKFGFIAEAAVMLWLLARGVNERKWVEKAAEQ